ncbi:hypothetical protein HB662_02225 [Roseomonas frigidaquae]|uniref:Uncharacterized protein n=1 Tax=Falsiroseomonas frigidaquae TaxID=487318 RepID=A0ABX1ESH5_9PROT|nr:hypothetical protein [Falsiroseomonas frigidaquae]NKE43576.1 hypothetical protein [Falsiroseomonas frigidaquae]
MTVEHRVAVRDAVAGILASRVPAVQGRIFRARTWPLSEAELPALLVYGWQEEKKRTGGTAFRSFYAVSFILAVEVRLNALSRAGTVLEAELEQLSGAVTAAVLQAAELLLPPDRKIERVDGVKTTLGIDSRSSEVAIGSALIAFDLGWTEVFEVPSPAVDCDADATSIAFRPIPPVQA